MIKLKGRIEKRNTCKLLVIHSKKLSEKLKDKISLENYGDGLIIKPKGNIHATIAAQKRLQIALTNLIKDKKIRIKEVKEIPIYLNEKEWKIKKEEILAKGVGNPLSNIVPKNLIIKNATIRNNRGRYYLDISSKKLYEISKNKIVKCLFNKTKDSIIIINSNETNARRITPHSKKRVQIAIPKELLKKSEKLKLDEKDWLPIKLKMNLKSFGLNIDDFYSIKEEKELVIYLSNEGIKIKLKEPSDPYDILIKEKKVGIEIHNSTPRYGDLVTRHKVKPALIRLRILEADFLVRKKELNKFFVIINKKWERGKYINELIKKENKNVKILFTNFKNKWEEKIGQEILKNI